MKLNKKQLEHFKSEYAFLKSRLEEEGPWHNLFNYGGETHYISVEHNEKEGVFTILVEDNWQGNIPADNEKHLKRIIEFLLDGTIEDLPGDYFL